MVGMYFLKYKDSCKADDLATWVYPKDSLVNIDISHTQVDFDWVKNNYEYLYPNDSLAFKINNPYDGQYNTNFMFYMTPYKLKTNYTRKKFSEKAIRKMNGRLCKYYNLP